MFNAQHFIDKFTAIPEEKWIKDQFYDPDLPSHCCALGHCGAKESAHDNAEALSLWHMFLDFKFEGKYLDIVNINDGERNSLTLGDTPRTRVLNALEIMKENGL